MRISLRRRLTRTVNDITGFWKIFRSPRLSLDRGGFRGYNGRWNKIE